MRLVKKSGSLIMDASTDKAILCPYGAAGGSNRAEFLACSDDCAAFYEDYREESIGFYCKAGDLIIGCPPVPSTDLHTKLPTNHVDKEK